MEITKNESLSKVDEKFYDLKKNNWIMGVGGLEPPRAKSLDGF